MDALDTQIDSTAFESRLADVAASAPDDSIGLFGPTSTVWKINRESLLFLGAGCASLLQLAHPMVGTAIAQHSDTRQDPFARFHRTFASVYAMLFGTTEQALSRARKVRAVHERITGPLPAEADLGPSYAANTVGPLLWVHLTLWHTSMSVYERLFGTQAESAKDDYARDVARFAALFGIPETLTPGRWAALTRRFDDYVRQPWMRPTSEARATARFLLFERPGGLPIPQWLRDVTAELLPEQLRQGFNLPIDEASAKRSGKAFRRIRRVAPLLPARIRFVGPYQEASARISGGLRPDFLTRRINRFWIGQDSLTS